MFKFLRKMTEAPDMASVEARFPGAQARIEAALSKQRRQRAEVDATVKSMSEPTYKKFQGSLTDVADPAVFAHLQARSGSIDPRRAFALGAPNSPTGTGKRVGWNGRYTG